MSLERVNSSLQSICQELLETMPSRNALLHYPKTNGPTLAGVMGLAYRFGFIATDQNQGGPYPKFCPDVQTHIRKEMEIFSNYRMKFWVALYQV